MASANGPFFSLDMNLNMPIYRLHPYRYLKELFEGNLVLPATRTWSDPWEDLISRCCYDTIEDGNWRQVFLGNDRLPTFGQCWTTVPESDALWKTYSLVEEKRFTSSVGEDERVRLKTTARKLVNALAKGMGADRARECFICTMKYVEEDELTSIAANGIAQYREKAFSGVSGHADALSLKRTAFEHEKEVRLIYVDSEKRYEGESCVHVSIDPTDLIEEITLDPRPSAHGGIPTRTEWLRTNGFKNPVNPCMLYIGAHIKVPLFKIEEFRRAAEVGQGAGEH